MQESKEERRIPCAEAANKRGIYGMPPLMTFLMHGNLSAAKKMVPSEIQQKHVSNQRIEKIRENGGYMKRLMIMHSIVK
jgi:hypothetical protein